MLSISVFALCIFVKMEFNYSGDLKSELVWIVNGQKEFGLQMVHTWNGIWNPNKWPPFGQKPFEIDQKCPNFDWLRP